MRKVYGCKKKACHNLRRKTSSTHLSVMLRSGSLTEMLLPAEALVYCKSSKPSPLKNHFLKPHNIYWPSDPNSIICFFSLPGKALLPADMSVLTVHISYMTSTYIYISVDSSVCQLDIVGGSCTYFTPVYGFDIYSLTCTRFLYSGCNGNDNRFKWVRIVLSVNAERVILSRAHRKP